MELSVENREFVKYKGVWKVIDKQSGELYYVKRATPSEVAMTKRASQFNLPEDSLLKLPEIPFGPERLSQDILSEVLAWKDELDPNDSRSSILITKAHPVPDAVPTLVNDSLASALRNIPIKESEFKSLIRDVEKLNKAGIFNHDFMSNLFPVRDAKGNLSFYAIDFEPDTFSKIYPGKHEDVEQIKGQRKELRKKGLLVRSSFKEAIKEILPTRKNKKISISFQVEAPPRRPSALRSNLERLTK